VNRGTEPYAHSGRVVAALGLTGMLVIAQLYLSLPLAPAVAATFEVEGVAQILTSSFGATYAAGFLLLPALLRRSSLYNILTGSLILSAAAASVAAVAPTWQSLVAARLAQGITASAFTPAVLTYLKQYVAPGQRRGAAGLVAGCYLSAVTVAQLAGQVGVAAVGWRGVLAITSAGYAVASLLLFRSLVSSLDRTEMRRTAGGSITDVLAVVVDMHVLLVVSSTALVSLVALHAALDRLPDFDETVQTIARLASLPALLAAWPASLLMSRWDVRSVLRNGLGVCVAGDACTAVLAACGAPAAGLFSGIIVCSIGAALTVPALIARVQAVEPTGLLGPPLYMFALFAGVTVSAIPVWSPVVLATGLLVIHLAATVLAVMRDGPTVGKGRLEGGF
jgi:predicted MFS family arabinose efflux permease